MGMFAAEEAREPLGSATLAVVRLDIGFHHELFFPAIARIGSRVQSVGRTSFAVRQAGFHRSECIASATATCVLFDPDVRRSVPVVAPILRVYLLRPT